MTYEIRKLSNAIGAEVLDFDASDITPDKADALRELFREHCLLLFRNQELTPEQHIGLTRVFGTPDLNESIPDYRHPDYPEVVLLTNEVKEGKASASGQVGRQWHSDQSMTLQPTLGSVLRAVQLPEVGGDTMFGNMYTAFETLSEPLRAFLDGMEAVHDVTRAAHLRNRPSDYLEYKRKLTPPVVQPVVRIHPETGRKALYVSEMMTSHFVGMTFEESQPILEYLYVHSVRPEFTYRHQWRVNDVLIWDNRCTIHNALADFDQSQTRTMYRTAIEGEPLGHLLEQAEKFEAA